MKKHLKVEEEYSMTSGLLGMSISAVGFAKRNLDQAQEYDITVAINLNPNR